MSDRYWGTVHLVPRGWDDEAEDADERIEYTFEHAGSHLRVAIELWALCDEGRAAEIDQVLIGGYEREPHLLGQSGIDALLRLLDGLEECLLGTFMDAAWRVPPDRIPELERRTTMLEIDDREGAVPDSAIAAGLSRVAIARDILRTARDEQLDILLG